MKVLRIVASSGACVNTEVEMRAFTPQCCLTDAYGNAMMAHMYWDNHACQSFEDYQTISTAIPIKDTDRYRYITYVRRTG